MESPLTSGDSLNAYTITLGQYGEQMLIEIISIAVLIVFVVSLSKEKAAGASRPAAASPPKQVLHLTLADTQPFQGNTDFLRGFAVPKQLVADLRYFCSNSPLTERQLPSAVRNCVSTCYSEGHGRSWELAQFMTGYEALRPSQALYFALIAPPSMTPFIVTFLAKSPAKS